MSPLGFLFREKRAIWWLLTVTSVRIVAPCPLWPAQFEACSQVLRFHLLDRAVNWWAENLRHPVGFRSLVETSGIFFVA